MRIPVLTYHSMRISGNDYEDNDHVALREDLELIERLGLRVVPAHWPVQQLTGERRRSLDRCVVLTFDDGSWFDWHDIEHPTCGAQRSFANILADFRAARTGRQPHLHATAFVIASPEARRELDRKGMVGRGWWSDGWWREAQDTGYLNIENHSWDHNHDLLERTAQRDGVKGDFHAIDNYPDADAQVRQAADYIDRFYREGGCSLFAYPYGHAGDYLAEEYLPRFQREHRMRAAFTTEPRPLQAGDDRWRLPRYVCARDWHSPAELESLLRDAGGA